MNVFNNDTIIPNICPDTQLLTAREAASNLRISERTLWSLTKSGKLIAVRIGHRVLYDPADLRQFIISQKTIHHLSNN